MADKPILIIDTSVVAKLFFPETLHDEAVLFFRHFTKSHQLLAPALIDYEFGNICWKKSFAVKYPQENQNTS